MKEDTAIQLINVSLDFPVTKSGATHIKDFFMKRAETNGSKFYRAVDNMDLEIRAGEVFGVIGPNGAGKSTLLQILGGIDRPDSGTIKSDSR